MKTSIAILAMVLFMLSGCAMPPDQSEIEGLPVIKFGEPVPKEGDYILHFPAGKTISTDVSIEGNIFEQPAQETLKVKLRREIYGYKKWVSYDKRTWISGQDALGVNLDIKIPGYHYPKEGHIKLKMSEK